MDRATKSETIEELRGLFAEAGAVVVTHYEGLTVRDTEDLRAKLRAQGARLRMVKNTLALKALNGTAEAAASLFTGPVAIAYGPDAVSAAKVATQFAKDNEALKIIGGLMGEQILDAKAVEALAKLPSLDALRGKLLGLINAPATRIAGVLRAPAGKVARVISAYSEKAAA
jgi:large subunit ribosomal protein L10